MVHAFKLLLVAWAQICLLRNHFVCIPCSVECEVDPEMTITAVTNAKW